MSDAPPPHNPQQPYGQQPPSGYHQHGGYPPGPPPKKKHTLRNVLLIGALLLVLLVGGCIALIGGVANEVDKALDEEAQNDKPTKVQEGQAFEHDGYEVADGWTVAKDGLGGVTIKNMKVTAAEEDEDLPDSGRSALLTFRFYKGNEVLAEVTCSSNEMQVGETSPMDCFGDGDFPTGYDTIKVADAF